MAIINFLFLSNFKNKRNKLVSTLRNSASKGKSLKIIKYCITRRIPRKRESKNFITLEKKVISLLQRSIAGWNAKSAIEKTAQNIINNKKKSFNKSNTKKIVFEEKPVSTVNKTESKTKTVRLTRKQWENLSPGQKHIKAFNDIVSKEHYAEKKLRKQDKYRKIKLKKITLKKKAVKESSPVKKINKSNSKKAIKMFKLFPYLRKRRRGVEDFKFRRVLAKRKYFPYKKRMRLSIVQAWTPLGFKSSIGSLQEMLYEKEIQDYLQPRFNYYRYKNKYNNFKKVFNPKTKRFYFKLIKKRETPRWVNLVIDMKLEKNRKLLPRLLKKRRKLYLRSFRKNFGPYFYRVSKEYLNSLTSNLVHQFNFSRNISLLTQKRIFMYNYQNKVIVKKKKRKNKKKKLIKLRGLARRKVLLLFLKKFNFYTSSKKRKIWLTAGLQKHVKENIDFFKEKWSIFTKLGHNWSFDKISGIRRANTNTFLLKPPWERDFAAKTITTRRIKKKLKKKNRFLKYYSKKGRKLFLKNKEEFMKYKQRFSKNDNTRRGQHSSTLNVDISKLQNVSLTIKNARSNYYFTVTKNYVNSSKKRDTWKVFSSGSLKNIKTARKRRDMKTFTRLAIKVILFLEEKEVKNLSEIKIKMKRTRKYSAIKRFSLKKFLRLLRYKEIRVKNIKIQLFKSHGIMRRAPKRRRK